MLTFIRNILSDRSDDFTFKRPEHTITAEIKTNTGLYIHIPFCKNSCPYCPYNKISYNEDIAREYKNALIKEIRLYYDQYGYKEFSSIYFGGGTPTLMTNELEEIFEQLYKYFSISGKIAIETTPDSIDKEVLKKLKSRGFNLLSIGIQSFNNEQLKKIGRNYDSSIAVRSIEKAIDAGFETVNIDLIFAIENQCMDDIRNDLNIAIHHKADQITCYPLFTFPYSEIGELKKLGKLKLPSNRIRKKMYFFITNFLKENGYNRSNIWSFNNEDHREIFSSVTRDHYLGMGAGAGSYNGHYFYFNTFSVREYINKVNKGLPVSIYMEVSPKLEKLFWLYWRCYETVISKREYYDLFHKDLIKEFNNVIRLIRFLGFVEQEEEDIIRLNTRGAHWIHLLQNHYALNYVNKIWSASKIDPWPEKIKL